MRLDEPCPRRWLRYVGPVTAATPLFHRLTRIARGAGIALLFLIVALCLAITIVPPFLDRIYYRGPAGSHYDGARFFNPDGEMGAPS
jgi:hypothetical protein